jgi:PhnB protein
MDLNIYLNFNGNCREVFDYYKATFGGDFLVFQTFADGPDDMQVPEADLDKVMHISYPIGDSVLMGSDTVEAFGGKAIEGNNFSISCVPDSREECDRIFTALSDGGIVKMPMAETFWGSYFGMCQDRFGINWMINMDTQGEVQ